MTELRIAAIVFTCVFGAAMTGLFVGNALPPHHLSQDSKDVVKLGTALIATMAALVLSLLISSSKSYFDRMNEELVQNAARVVFLDRTLADYGPETKEARHQVKSAYAARIALLFPGGRFEVATADTPEEVVSTESLSSRLWALSPTTEAQRGLQARALEIAAEMTSTRWLLLMQEEETVPMPILIVLTVWLVVIFGTFGLFAPRNATVVAALFVCAASVAGAVLLILEMHSPFRGLMKLASGPMYTALANLGR